MMESTPSFKTAYTLLGSDIANLTPEEILARHVDRDSPDVETQIKVKKVKDILSANRMAKIIFGSHSGCGKTTELRCLAHYLTDKERFLTVFIPSVSHLRAELWKKDLFFTDLLFLLVDKTIEEITRRHLIVNQILLNDLQYLLEDTFDKEDITFKKPTGEEENVKIDTLRDSLLKLWRKISADVGSFRQKANVSMPELRDKFNELITDCVKQNNQLTGISIIIDDLEKLSKNACDFLNTYKQDIRMLRCCLVITIPPHYFYNLSDSQLQQYRNEFPNVYDHVYFLPPFQVHNKNWDDNVEQIKLMANIVKGKIPSTSNPIPDHVLENSARLSGGLIPDFLTIIRNCCLKVIDIPPAEINIQMLDQTLKDVFKEDLVEEYKRKITNNEDQQLLKDVHKNKQMIYSKSFDDLIAKKAILEYVDNSGQRWYDVHPAIIASFWKNDPIIGRLLSDQNVWDDL